MSGDSEELKNGLASDAICLDEVLLRGSVKRS
jgi:hypothetical protein